MSRRQFESLSDGAFVFRIAEVGKSFLPEGARLPTDRFFVCSSTDKEGDNRGRPAGLSVWEKALTTLAQAKKLRFSPNEPPDNLRAFGLLTGNIRSIGREKNIAVDVVADPLPKKEGPGAEGHSLIEGLSRPKPMPPGKTRNDYKSFRIALADACSEIFS